MNLVGEGMFHPRWSADIHDEWMRNVVKNMPQLALSRLERTRTLMDTFVPDAIVAGYSHLIDQLELPDPDDRHVLAAAIKSGAQAIVTFNLRDFPPAILQAFGILAIHPDDFLVDSFNENPNATCRAMKKHRLSLKNPPKTVHEYLESFDRQNLPRIRLTLETFKELL